MSKFKNKQIELEIASIGFEGVSIARQDGLVYMLKRGLPGDKVIAKIYKKRNNYYEGSILEILEPSPVRKEPFCRYYEACGGCVWQCLDYKEQLKWKERQVIDAFERIGKVRAAHYNSILPAVKTIEYRNKMDYSFGASRWLTKAEIESEIDYDFSFALGLHVPGRFDKVIDVEECHIQPKRWNDILSVIRNKAKELGITAQNTHTQTGFLKGLTIRGSLSTDETMVTLVTTDIKKEEEQIFIDWMRVLANKLPFITSINHASNNNNAVNIGELQWTSGKDFITEEILGIKYQISPFSFFQTNSSQLVPFISAIIDAASLNKKQVVWDLYCGTGSITLPSSKHCKDIYGVEIVESAIKDAKINATANDIKNAHFYTADLHNKDIPNLLNSLPKPNVIILDPPRSGLHPNLIKHLLEIAAKRLVYVSCNPATQARDLSELASAYQIVDSTPVDMFPNTYHIENIVTLVTIE